MNAYLPKFYLDLGDLEHAQPMLFTFSTFTQFGRSAYIKTTFEVKGKSVGMEIQGTNTHKLHT